MIYKDENLSFYRSLLDEFLERWPLSAINKLSLPQYVSVGNPDTFCQWLETKTRSLGSIKGITSIKFGIYKRKNISKHLKYYCNDNLYTWQRYYGSSRSEAFNNVKKEIKEIIKLSSKGDFDPIDNFHLSNFVKWKIAFLYSNERLIPIFKKEVLIKIANYYGQKFNYKTPVALLHKLLISKKPSHLSVYQFMDYLYNKFGDNNVDLRKRKNKKRVHRKPISKINFSRKTKRTRKISSYSVSNLHDILQNKLWLQLKDIYGSNNIKLEEDWVDIKLLQKKLIRYYEIKTSSYASDCIREALGQILSYTFRDSDIRQKEIVIVGQYPPNEDELAFINYIRKMLKINFSYQNIDL